jgi:hypothetical protein
MSKGCQHSLLIYMTPPKLEQAAEPYYAVELHCAKCSSTFYLRVPQVGSLGQSILTLLKEGSPRVLSSL